MDAPGLVLTIDQLEAKDARTLKTWIEPIVQSVGAEILVTDDADGFKTVADEAGLLHQVCKSHVKRNTEALIDEFRPLVVTDHDGSDLRPWGHPTSAPWQTWRYFRELIVSRQPEPGAELEQMHRRYLSAPAPRKGRPASLASSLTFALPRSVERGARRLTRYHTWQGLNQEKLDGTNNACERATLVVGEGTVSLDARIQGPCQCPAGQSLARLVRQRAFPREVPTWPRGSTQPGACTSTRGPSDWLSLLPLSEQPRSPLLFARREAI